MLNYKPVELKKEFTVSEITARIKKMLESSFQPVWITGEISNYKLYASGHAYFSLKDSSAQIRCVMFKYAVQKSSFQPADGLQMRVLGTLTVFETQGIYQIRVERVEPSGVGALHQAFELLKTKLLNEGLFSETRKKTLPRFPKIIGIVTSESGAVIRDIVNIVARRYPLVQLKLYPSKVQGDGAAKEVSLGILYFNGLKEQKKPDVIIIGRGGGSLEDLWAFNEESLARAIAASSIPIVSAVGHETDFTIADFVADVRAPTPSAAAELAVPDMTAIKTTLVDHGSRLKNEQNRIFELRSMRLKAFASSHFFKIERNIEDWQMQIDSLSDKLLHFVTDKIKTRILKIASINSRFLVNTPVHRLKLYRSKIEYSYRSILSAVSTGVDLKKQMFYRMQADWKKPRFQHFQSQIELMQARFHALDPKAILGRGYAICLKKSGQPILMSEQVEVDESIIVELGKGKLECVIQDKLQ